MQPGANHKQFRYPGRLRTRWERFVAKLVPPVAHIPAKWDSPELLMQNLPSTKRQFWLALGTLSIVLFGGIVISLFANVANVLVLVTSPITGLAKLLTSLTLDASQWWEVVWKFAGTITVTAWLMTDFVLDGPRRGSPFNTYLEKRLIEEEHAFREGSEDWTLQQRVLSCVAFGLTRLGRLYIPLAGSLTKAISGALLMWEYLYQVRQTGSREEALRRVIVLRWHAHLLRKQIGRAIIWAAGTLLLCAVFSVIVLLLTPG